MHVLNEKKGMNQLRPCQQCMREYGCLNRNGQIWNGAKELDAAVGPQECSQYLSHLLAALEADSICICCECFHENSLPLERAI